MYGMIWKYIIYAKETNLSCIKQYTVGNYDKTSEYKGVEIVIIKFASYLSSHVNTFYMNNI